MSKKIENPATDFEKILIASGAINYMAQVIAMVKRDYDFLVNNRPEDEILKQSHRDQCEALSRAAKGMRKIAEDLGNYLNNHDIADDQIVHFTGAAMDLLYDRIEAS